MGKMLASVMQPRLPLLDGGVERINLQTPQVREESSESDESDNLVTSYSFGDVKCSGMATEAVPGSSPLSAVQKRMVVHHPQ
ncbi:hypothetical protein JRQ81_012123, partial [Phrynocephalus forsythii]